MDRFVVLNHRFPLHVRLAVALLREDAALVDVLLAPFRSGQDGIDTRALDVPYVELGSRTVREIMASTGRFPPRPDGRGRSRRRAQLSRKERVKLPDDLQQRTLCPIDWWVNVPGIGGNPDTHALPVAICRLWIGALLPDQSEVQSALVAITAAAGDAAAAARAVDTIIPRAVACGARLAAVEGMATAAAPHPSATPPPPAAPHAPTAAHTAPTATTTHTRARRLSHGASRAVSVGTAWRTL